MATLKLQLNRSLSQTLSTTDDVIHTDPQHGASLLHGFQTVRQQALYFDVTLVVEDYNIPAHRIILAACSPYFAAMFGHKMLESTQTSITLPNQKKQNIDLMLDFIYTGRVKITGETVEELLCAANFFGVLSLQTACCEFLVKNMDASNCVGIMHFAEHLGCKELQMKAQSFVIEHIADVMNTEEFYDLTLEELQLFLEDEFVCQFYSGERLFPARQEQKLCELVLHYIQKDLPHRTSSIIQLLKLVRLPLLLPADISWLEKKLNDVKAPQECLALVRTSSNPAATKGNDLLRSKPRKGAAVSIFETPLYGTGGHMSNTADNEIEGELSGEFPYVYVKGVKISIRLWDNRRVIGGLRVFYSNGDQTVLGCEPGIEQYDIHLAANEQITRIDLNSGWLIDCLTFYTNTGQVLGPYGGDGGGERFVSLPEGAKSPFLSRIFSRSMHTQGDLAIYDLHFVFMYYEN